MKNEYISLSLRRGGFTNIRIDQIRAIEDDYEYRGEPPVHFSKVFFGHGHCAEVTETGDEVMEQIREAQSHDSLEKPVATAIREPIVLSIRATSEFACIGIKEPFLFEVGGKPYLYGSLDECIKSRDAYAIGCEQNDVPFVFPEYASAEEVENPNFISDPNVCHLGGLTLKEVMDAPGHYRSDVDKSRVLFVDKSNAYLNAMDFPWRFPLNLMKGTWTSISEDEFHHEVGNMP